MLSMKINKPLRRQQGFTLIEVLVAVLICSIGLLGIVGLQARAMQYSAGSEDVIRAMRLADEVVWVIQDRRAVPIPTDAFTTWQAHIQDPKTGLPDATGEISNPNAFGVVRITITWRAVGDSQTDPPQRRYMTEVALAL